MIRRLGPWPVLALVLTALLPSPLRAGDSEAGAEICERAILEGARAEGVPEGVLHAISLTETGRPTGGRLRPWPWAINREGQGFWFASREQAMAFAAESLAAGRRSFDVGCFQINYHWHGHNFPSLEAMFDPAVGAAYAARFLRSLHAERGDWSLAAGAYHSQTPARAGVYRARFDRILAGLGGQPLTVATAPPEEPKAGPPRKSRTRLSRGPKIITVPPRAPAAPAPAEEAAAGSHGVFPARQQLTL
jgi:hypothetical protein